MVDIQDDSDLLMTVDDCYLQMWDIQNETYLLILGIPDYSYLLMMEI